MIVTMLEDGQLHRPSTFDAVHPSAPTLGDRVLLDWLRRRADGHSDPMPSQSVVLFVVAAMRHATVEQLDSGEFFASVPQAPGAFATAATRTAAAVDLVGVLAEWTELGLRLGHLIDPIDGVTPTA